jgi:transcription elongation GreA/GreB family factor
MDKIELVEQLAGRIQATAQIALRASEDAAVEARDGATPQEKREDARVALEQSRMAKAQNQRAQRALAELDALASFRPLPLPGGAAIALGALVEVEDEDTGEGRTFFLAPVGAGLALTGPGGDGHLSVVTPASPIGRAVLGRKVGAVIDINVEGVERAWRISWVG